MPCPELEIQCARIKTIFDEIERFPTVDLVEKLCEAAERGCWLDARCAFWFFAVRDLGAGLLEEGGADAQRRLPEAVARLEAVVVARSMTRPEPAIQAVDDRLAEAAI